MPQISNATKKHKDKITNSSRTKAARKEAQRQYEEINQEVRRDIRRDKRKFIDELSKEAETAAEKHSMKDLYDLTKKCIWKEKLSIKTQDESGSKLTKQEDQLKR